MGKLFTVLFLFNHFITSIFIFFFWKIFNFGIKFPHIGTFKIDNPTALAGAVRPKHSVVLYLFCKAKYDTRTTSGFSITKIFDF